MPLNNRIALNVTRTRVTVLVFNLTIISVMMSILGADRGRGGSGGVSVGTSHLTTSIALFVGFYVAPLAAVINGSRLGGRRWPLVAYYFALQAPIYWVYASAWRLEYATEDHPTDMLGLFALQFAQPLLWLRQ